MVKTKVSKQNVIRAIFFNHIVSTRLTIAEDIAAMHFMLSYKTPSTNKIASLPLSS